MHYWLFLRFSALLSRSWLRIRERRRQDAAADLGRALALAATNGYRNCDPWWDPEAIDDIAKFSYGRSDLALSISALLARTSAS